MLVLKKSMLVTCGIAVTMLATLIQPASNVHAADAPEGEGLSGIISPEPPGGLWEDDFLELGDTWKEWSQGAADDVFNLFSEEELSIAEQREALEAVASRLRVMEVALKDEAYSKLHRKLAILYGRLKPQYDFAVAALDTIEQDPASVRDELLADAQENVLATNQKLLSFLDDYVGSEAWISYLKIADLEGDLNGKDPKAALGVLNPIAQKINQRGKLESDEQKEFLGKKPFLALTEAIGQYRKAVNAKPPKKDVAALRGELKTLREAITEYSETLRSADAMAIHESLGKIQQLALDGGGRIGEVMQAHYINYNLHVVASETFLDKVVKDKRKESGVVSDFVLGASVYGNQETEAEVGIDVKPDNNQIRFDLVLNGQTHSNTSGSTQQATVYTSGNHAFRATKEITFDGERFETGPTQVGVNANNHTYAASTKLDGIPLLGGIARGIAKKTAQKKRPQSEAITRSKIAEKVRPEFDEEADKQFETATKDLNEKFYKGLRETNLYPSAMNFRSSDSHILADTRTMLSKEIGGGRPLLLPVSQTGAVVDIHQSTINNTFNQMGVAGKTMTEEEFSEHMRLFFNKAFSLNLEKKEKKESYDEEDPTSFIFSENDPLRIRFADGEVVIIIRAGLKQPGDEDIPAQEISVPLTFDVKGEKILMEAGRVGVAPIGEVDNFALQTTRAGIMRKKFGRAIPSQELDAEIKLNKDEPDDTPTLVYVREVDSIAGWLRLVVE